MNTTTGTSPESLRAAMVERIIQRGHARSDAVKRAMLTESRHRYVPAASVQDAYADPAVIIKSADNGDALSCASEPAVIAMQLDQLDICAGDHIAEIGAGTGYNASLLRQLTGPSGQVTTVDIDKEVTAHARAMLDANGHPEVRVIQRDGALGAPEHAPYDRMIVTVGAWDVPAAWRNQLAEGGRLVVPLRWRGQTRSVAFVRDGDLLRSDSMALCGFVPMIGQDGERSGHIDSHALVTLYWDADQPVDPAALSGVLNADKAEAWSAVTIGGQETLDGIWLRLTATEPDTCRIAAEPVAVETGLCHPAVPGRSPALVDGESLAYLTYRRVDEPDRGAELGAFGHGPDGGELADRLRTQIRAWNNDRTYRPTITAFPASEPLDTLPPGLVISKRETHLLVS